MTELPDGYYAAKKKINLDFPFTSVSLSILNYAKLRMLEFYYDCVDKYLSREDFEYSEMDTDSAYMAISGDSFEELIKPYLHKEFENDKHNWFVTPLTPQGKRTPGLFKVEFKGDKKIGLCSKSYCTERFATDTTPGQVKLSMKGVNKGQFKNPTSYYEHILTSVENFRACNSGIRSKDQTMATYKQYKHAFTYFYLKRKLLEDG